LRNYLSNYTEYDIIDYNNKVNLIAENIRDFICLHYISERNDTEFWKDLKNIDIPPTLSENLIRWEKRLPIIEDFQQTQYFLFNRDNWLQILNGLDLIDKNELSKRYDMMTPDGVKFELNNNIQNYIRNEEENIKRHFKHKQYLTYMREVNYD